MNMWLMYLVLKLDNIHELFRFLLSLGLTITIIGGVVLGFCWLYCTCEKDTHFMETSFVAIKRLYIKFAVVTALLLVVGVLIPTTKQAAAIYLVPKVINNKQMRKMPDKLVMLANSWMDEQIKSIKNK